MTTSSLVTCLSIFVTFFTPSSTFSIVVFHIFVFVSVCLLYSNYVIKGPHVQWACKPVPGFFNNNNNKFL